MHSYQFFMYYDVVVMNTNHVSTSAHVQCETLWEIPTCYTMSSYEMHLFVK